MTDERKPLAPDRPGRYLQRNGEVVHIDEVCGRWSRQAEDSCYYHWNNGTSVTRPLYDIIARAPDDAEWCLAQAQLFAKAIDSVVIPTAVYTVLSQTHKTVCTVQNSAIAEDAKKLRAAFLEHTKCNADEKAKP